MLAFARVWRSIIGRSGVLQKCTQMEKVGQDPICVMGLNQNKGQKFLFYFCDFAQTIC